LAAAAALLYVRRFRNTFGLVLRFLGLPLSAAFSERFLLREQVVGQAKQHGQRSTQDQNNTGHHVSPFV